MAATVSGYSSWIFPIAWFSGFMIALFLSVVMVRQNRFLIPLVCFALAPGMFFTFEYYRILVYGLASLIAIWGVRHIDKDLDLNIKMSLRKSLSIGRSIIVLALAILICGQYYSDIKKYKVINPPEFRTEKITATIMPTILPMLGQDLSKLNNGRGTIDEFILESQRKTMSYPSNLDASQKEQLERLILNEGRKQYSSLAGREIKGDEKVTDIISSIVDRKIDEFIAAGFRKSEDLPVLPVIFVAILFLILIPLGNFLGWFWIIITTILFHILVFFEIIKIKTVMVAAEKIE